MERNKNEQSHFYSAFKFFHANGGGIVGQSALGAIALARAEERLHQLIDSGMARIIWEYDNDIDLSFDEYGTVTKALQEGRLESRLCEIQIKCQNHKHCLRCNGWESVASLGGIISAFDSRDTYPRIVEAELATEIGEVK